MCTPYKVNGKWVWKDCKDSGCPSSESYGTK